MNKNKVCPCKSSKIRGFFNTGALAIGAAFVLALPSAAFAVADFSGTWVASAGTVSSTVGISSTCTKITIRVVQTATEIRTDLYNAECKSYGSKWGPILQYIRAGKVFERDSDGNEDEVGTISDDTLITVSQSGTMQYAYNLKLVPQPDGSKKLMSYYGVKGAIGAIVTEGTHDLIP
jgi:hypothetical protein